MSVRSNLPCLWHVRRPRERQVARCSLCGPSKPPNAMGCSHSAQCNVRVCMQVIGISPKFLHSLCVSQLNLPCFWHVRRRRGRLVARCSLCGHSKPPNAMGCSHGEGTVHFWANGVGCEYPLFRGQYFKISLENNKKQNNYKIKTTTNKTAK